MLKIKLNIELNNDYIAISVVKFHTKELEIEELRKDYDLSKFKDKSILYNKILDEFGIEYNDICPYLDEIITNL